MVFEEDQEDALLTKNQGCDNRQPHFHQAFPVVALHPVPYRQALHDGGQHEQIRAYHAALAAPIHEPPTKLDAGQCRD